MVVTPLQTAVALSAIANQGMVLRPQILLNQTKDPDVIRTLPMPKSLQKILLEGMRRVVLKTYQTSLLPLSKIYRDYPEAISDYIDLKEELLAKPAQQNRWSRSIWMRSKGPTCITTSGLEAFLMRVASRSLSLSFI